MRDALLILWIALMGADRIDLLAGAGPITITPYLVLMPLVFVLEVPALAALPRVRFRREGQVYVMLVALLGAVAVASAMGSTDPLLSARRVALLVFQLFAILFVALVLANRPDPGAILVKGAYLGLMVSFVFNVAQAVVWLTNPMAASGGSIIDLVPGRFGSIVPRLGGQTLDPNRGGMVMCIHLFFLYRFGKPTRARVGATAGTVLSVLFTLSRSAALGGAGILMMALLEARRVRLTHGRVAAGLLAAAAAVLAILSVPAAAELAGEIGALLGERFSLRDKGNSSHFELIGRALEVAGRSWKNALIGIGYGNAASVLTDMFPDSKYANFHSIYATFLAEMGVLALMLGLVVMLYAAVSPNPFRPVAVGFLAFNVFYQLSTEPAFWLVLACAWLGVGAPAEKEVVEPPRPLPLPRRVDALAG